VLRLAIIGDFDRGVTAHEGIDASLARIQQTTWPDLSWEWWHTSLLPEYTAHLTEVIGVPDGVWCTPASPYANTEAALAAIRYARETETPFLGTCGGFQHAVLEFVRNVLGDEDAAHAELAPGAARFAITPLACELVEISGLIEGVPGTRCGALYTGQGEREEYHCRFGINPDYLERLEAAGLRCAARDDNGEPRAMEHASHPYFVGTLFQPERRALRSGVGSTAAMTGAPAALNDAADVHPLIVQFVEAASEHRMRRLRGPAPPGNLP
jgi:CTP synthase (UTP-ammonia lyase)